MSLAIPVTNGHLMAGAQVYGGATGAPPGVDGSSSAADVQGTGALSAPHNTPMHVAGVLLFGGAIIVGLHYLGFRFAFDVGMGR